MIRSSNLLFIWSIEQWSEIWMFLRVFFRVNCHFYAVKIYEKIRAFCWWPFQEFTNNRFDDWKWQMMVQHTHHIQWGKMSFSQNGFRLSSRICRPFAMIQHKLSNGSKKYSSSFWRLLQSNLHLCIQFVYILDLFRYFLTIIGRCTDITSK